MFEIVPWPTAATGTLTPAPKAICPSAVQRADLLLSCLEGQPTGLGCQPAGLGGQQERRLLQTPAYRVQWVSQRGAVLGKADHWSWLPC